MILFRNFYHLLISTTLLTVFLIEYSPGRTAEGLGNFKSYTKIDHGVLVAADNGTIMLEVYSPTVIRVRVTKGEFLKDFSYAVIRNPEGMFTGIQEDGKELRLSTDSLEIFVSEKPVRLHFYNSVSLTKTMQGLDSYRKEHRRLHINTSFRMNGLSDSAKKRGRSTAGGNHM